MGRMSGSRWPTPPCALPTSRAAGKPPQRRYWQGLILATSDGHVCLSLADLATVLTPAPRIAALRAEEDDMLLDQDVTFTRSDEFGRGFIGSTLSANARAYYLVRDVRRTEAATPLDLVRGQTETVKFSEPMRRGGRLSVLATGAAVQGRAIGELGTEMPFANLVIDSAAERELASGLTVVSSGTAQLAAFYTAP